MSDIGEVDRETVIMVLRANQVQISKLKEDSEAWFVLIKGERVEAQKLPQKVGRKTLQYLQYHFNVPIHYFYHPDMMPRTDKVQ